MHYSIFIDGAKTKNHRKKKNNQYQQTYSPYPVIGGVKYVFDPPPPTLTEDFRKIDRGLF